MQYKLVAIDLDGTLLDSQHRLSQANRAAVQACLERDVRVVLATGRMFASVRPFCEELGLSGPQITLNGAVVADAGSGELRGSHFLSEELLVRASGELQARGIPFCVFGPGQIYALQDTPHLQVLSGYGEPAPTYVPEISRRYIPQPAKLLAFLQEGPLQDELAALLGESLEVVRTGPLFFEFLMPGVSKGAALSELLARYTIAPAETLVIGDSYNDLSMFDIAGMSVAMGGSAPAIVARAKTTTAGCNEDGVAVAIERYILNSPQAR